VGDMTLKFFFSLHFILPWFVILLVLIHLFFLHESGSTSGLMCFGNYDKVNFYPFFIFKDIVSIFVILLAFGFAIHYPFSLGDPEIFIEANSLVRPVHIVPE